MRAGVCVCVYERERERERVRALIRSSRGHGCAVRPSSFQLELHDYAGNVLSQVCFIWVHFFAPFCLMEKRSEGFLMRLSPSAWDEIGF